MSPFLRVFVAENFVCILHKRGHSVVFGFDLLFEYTDALQHSDSSGNMMFIQVYGRRGTPRDNKLVDESRDRKVDIIPEMFQDLARSGQRDEDLFRPKNRCSENNSVCDLIISTTIFSSSTRLRI